MKRRSLHGITDQPYWWRGGPPPQLDDSLPDDPVERDRIEHERKQAEIDRFRASQPRGGKPLESFEP